MLKSVLDGSFDAGLLVEGTTGRVLHANEEALNLFVAPNLEVLLSHCNDAPKKSPIEGLLSFWSYSLTMHDESEANHDITKAEEGPDDTLSWEQIIKYAVKKSSNNGGGDGGDGDHPDEIKEWAVTGIKLESPEMAMAKSAEREFSSQKQQQASATSSPSSSGAGGKAAKPANPSHNKETFPGLLKLTCAATTDDMYNNLHNSLWILYVRHADYHDILATGSTTGGSHSRSQVQRTSRRSTSNRNKDMRLTLDDNGMIVDISDAALEAAKHDKAKESNWSWLSTDLIGKHISQAAIVGGGVPENAASNMPRAGMPARAAPPPQPFRMLDLILESGMEPGHAACPMSGFPLRIESNVSAMTTGGAQREENITEAAFEAALDPIFQIDEHGTIQMVNSAATKTFGWRRSEFLGSNINMICGGGHGDKHAAYMSRYLATGDTRVIGKNRELPAKRKDGSEFPIELGVVEVDTFAGDVRLFCGFVRDLTNIKARERLAQEMVEAALDPMFHINAAGKILMVNKAAMTTFGYSRNELLGQNVSIICGGSHSMNHDLYIKKYIRTGETRVIGKYRELPAKRKDGTEFTIQLAVVEIQTGTKNDDERMFVGFVHDLTRQKRDEDIMRGTIDTSLDPVLHINENGVIQLVNNATCSHLGWTREELVGENVSLIVGGEHQHQHGKYIERYLETGEKRAMGKKRKLTARRKDGSEMPILLGLSEIKINRGTERMFCAFLTDLDGRLTEEKS